MKAQGYCHFNNDENNRSFRINLFEFDWEIEQDPGCRDLGHGAVVWDAAVVLAKYMEKNFKDYDTKTLAKRKVLELGSGCGLGGIAFMMKGAEVSCTDLAAVTQRLTEKNVQMAYAKLKSSLKGTISAQTIQPRIYPIDWTQNPISLGIPISSSVERDETVDEADGKLAALSMTEETARDTPATAQSIGTTAMEASSASNFNALISGAPYDYVLLTDCVFSATLAEPLVNTILCGCGPRTTVICCHEIRDEDANAAFIAAFSKHFTFKRIPRSKLHEDYSNDLIEIIIGKPIRVKKSSSAGDSSASK